MSRWIKLTELWVRRRSSLPLLIVGILAVLLLFFNDETSMRLNMAYDHQIRELRKEIKTANDSAEYYRSKREALLHGTEDLEEVAREQYRMQRPTEDVYIIK